MTTLPPAATDNDTEIVVCAAILHDGSRLEMERRFNGMLDALGYDMDGKREVREIKRRSKSHDR